MVLVTCKIFCLSRHCRTQAMNTHTHTWLVSMSVSRGRDKKRWS